MTEVLEVEVVDTSSTDNRAIREALELIDQGLGDISLRTIISSSEMADLLLDVRCILAGTDGPLLVN